MKSYLDTLRPSEKRLVVGIGLVFFAVLNFVFVIPHFSDWGKVQDRMWEAQRKLRVYENEIQQTTLYSNEVRKLESEGLAVAQEEQTMHFSTAINGQAAQSGVSIISNSKITTRTNQFFLEQTQTLSVDSEEQQLVNFLYNLGSGNSLIRVRDLSVRPNLPLRQRLSSNVKLVASYQKKLPAKPAAAPASKTAGTAAPPSAAPKPASPTAKPTTASAK